MESILEYVNLAIKLAETLGSYFGIEPQLIVPVLVLVSLLANLIDLRRRWPNYKNSLLALLAFGFGCLVVFLTNFSLDPSYIKQGLQTGAMSAISYQFTKPVVKGMVSFASKRYKKLTGEELFPPEQFM